MGATVATMSYVQRRKDPHLQIAHEMLKRWAEWMLRYEANANIGYPARTIEGRAKQDGGIIRMEGKPTSKVPQGVMMPEVVSLADRAVKKMPKNWQAVVLVEYYYDSDAAGRVAEFQRRTGLTKRTYRSLLDAARAFVVGIRSELRSNEHRE